MVPVRLQLSRRKGFDLQALSLATNGLPAVNVARPSIFGNPFPVDVYGQVGAVDRFSRWIAGNMSSLESSQSSRCDKWSGSGSISLTSVRQIVRSEIAHLHGKNLACWCPPDQPCHADVLLCIANPEPEER